MPEVGRSKIAKRSSATPTIRWPATTPVRMSVVCSSRPIHSSQPRADHRKRRRALPAGGQTRTCARIYGAQVVASPRAFGPPRGSRAQAGGQMKPADHEALCDPLNEALDWLPPASASDDPAEAWRKVTADEFHEWRVARDARLVERFAAIPLNARGSRSSVTCNMRRHTNRARCRGAKRPRRRCIDRSPCWCVGPCFAADLALGQGYRCLSTYIVGTLRQVAISCAATALIRKEGSNLEANIRCRCDDCYARFLCYADDHIRDRGWQGHQVLCFRG